MARHNAGLREFYQGLRARGKPGKVALTAVMRKLVMQLNAITLRGPPGRRPMSWPRPPENRLTRNTDTLAPARIQPYLVDSGRPRMTNRRLDALVTSSHQIL